jgi:predicted HicB family RNase H-like nuclease
VYKTPWQGDPRVNIQNAGGKAKPYPMRQVLQAINRLISEDKKMADRYCYRVTWSEEDQEHVGLCAEFPSLSWLASSPEKALAGIRKLVRECVADLEAAGEPIPEPLSSKRFSGKFMVRVPPAVHRQLAMEAAESGVSLNRLVSSKLA